MHVKVGGELVPLPLAPSSCPFTTNTFPGGFSGGGGGGGLRWGVVQVEDGVDPWGCTSEGIQVGGSVGEGSLTESFFFNLSSDLEMD